MRKLFHITLFLLNWIAVLALLLSYASTWIAPDKWWVPAFFGLAYPYLLVGNILFMILWLLLKPKYFLLSFLTILIGVGHFTNYIQFKGKQSQHDEIKIVSYNVKLFFDTKTEPGNWNTSQITGFLAGTKAHIICLQETRYSRRYITDQQQVVNRLQREGYKPSLSKGDTGPVTFTKYPVLHTGEIRFKGSLNKVLFSDLEIDNDTVRVYNCHLQSVRIEPERYDVLDSMMVRNEEKNIEGARYLGIKLKSAFQKRSAQARTLRKHVDSSPYPVIVCGDFNDTPVSYTYKKVRGQLKDAFVASGTGIGSTYNGILPSFRIDYIFYDPIFDATNFEVVHIPHSDHFPVMCNLVRKLSKP